MNSVHLITSALAAFVVAACSGTSGGVIDTNGMTQADITTYRQLAIQTQDAASSYGATMTTSVLSVASCHTIHDPYDGQVRPWVSQMVQTAAEMDAFIEAHGGMTMNADMRCVSNAMLNELDYHRSVACALSDIAADRAEAVRHAIAMQGFTVHLVLRCGEMLDGFGGRGWHWMMMGGCDE